MAATIEVELGEYFGLQDDSLMLQALMEAGVDNWEGYDTACESYKQMVDERGGGKEHEGA
jgi:hypothetical protein